MKQQNVHRYVSPGIYMLQMTLENNACLMASGNDSGSGFTFGVVTKDETYTDTDWI